MNNNKVLLAFSGGLDTSFCAKYLSLELQLEVHTALVNTGGFSQEECEKVKQKALQLGSHSHNTLEETELFYQKMIRFLIYGNVLKNQNYPLSVSAERIHQAVALAKYAKEIKADYIAHGSTGAGNDQIRFDLIFQLIAPEIEIITPVRDRQLSRQEEIDYLSQNGHKLLWNEAKYSINKGLWGTSVGGAETLTSGEPLPEVAYPSSVIHDTSSKITLHFEKGELQGLNNKIMSPVEAIQKLSILGSEYGIGRDIHVGDTMIGIKGRVGFEAPAAHIIISAHRHLEKHTLSKWQIHWKEQLGNWYGMFVHEAQYLEPVMRNIETFLISSQTKVTGDVFVELQPYRFSILGIKSPHDLMESGFGTYGEMNLGWNAEDVKGFTKIMANPIKIFNQLNGMKW